jgi:hypothetical protein
VFLVTHNIQNQHFDEVYIFNSDDEEDLEDNDEYEWVPLSNPGHGFKRVKKKSL